MDVNTIVSLGMLLYGLATAPETPRAPEAPVKQDVVYVKRALKRADPFVKRQSWETPQDHILRLSREGATESLTTATQEEAQRILEGLNK